MSFTFDKLKEMLSLDDRNKQYELQLLCEEDCNIVGPRNDGKTTTITAYLLWKAITTPNIVIGVTSPTTHSSRQIIDRLRSFINQAKIIDLVDANNRTWLEFHNGAKIISDVANGDAFRGFGTDIIYIDEVNNIRQRDLMEFMANNLPVLQSRKNGRLITSSFRGW